MTPTFCRLATLLIALFVMAGPALAQSPPRTTLTPIPAAQTASVQAPPSRPVRSQDVLVLGRISDDPNQHYEALRPLLDYVVPRMRDVGIREGRILMARDAQQMISYLRRGRVDWITETPAMAVDYRDRAGAEILLATERGGGTMYHTVFFVRRDSGITTLQDLAGRAIAFQNPYSTSSYVSPAAELLAAGLGLDLLLSPKDRPEPDRVGYVFARSESNISTWVHKRLVDAGAFSNLDWSDLSRLPESFRQDLTVIHETAPYPRAVEVVRPRLNPDVQARLREILLAAGDDPAAREPLRRFFGTSRFVPLDDEAEAALKRLQIGMANVRRQLE